MCTKCEGAVRYDDIKKILLYKKGCDWLPLPAIVASTVTTPGLGQGGIDDWNGETPIPDAPGLPTDYELYTTMDSLKCAKATALVNQIWDLMSVYTALETGNTLTEIASLAWGLLGVSGDIWLTNAISTALLAGTGEIYADIADELENIFVNDGLKEDLICMLVDQMEPPKRVGSFELFGEPVLLNTLTAADIKAAVDAFKEATPDSDYAHKWVGLFPVNSWMEIVTPKIPGTECACDTYDPTPSTEGMGMITAVFGIAQNLADFTAGTPQDFADGVNEAGELMAADRIGSTSLASLAGNQGIGVMFVAPAGVLIERTTYSFEWMAGSNDPFDFAMARSNGSATAWTNMGEGHVGAAGLIPNPTIDSETDLSAQPVTHHLINYAAYGTDSGDNNIMQMYDIRFDLRAADGSWARYNVPLGTLFPL